MTPLADRVRDQILAELHGGNPSAACVASKLGISVRHLARLLRAEGTSHQRLLDETRAALARRYLGDEHRRADEVATLLGYSEVSALRRARKRWLACGALPPRAA